MSTLCHLNKVTRRTAGNGYGKFGKMVASENCLYTADTCGLTFLGMKIWFISMPDKKCYPLPWRPKIDNSGQSYKHFTLVNYDSRVVLWGIFQSGITLDSYFMSVKCFKIGHRSFQWSGSVNNREISFSILDSPFWKKTKSDSQLFKMWRVERD